MKRIEDLASVPEGLLGLEFNANMRRPEKS